MHDNISLKESHKINSDIRVLIIAESQRQRLAFSDTVHGCGFTVVGCLSRAQLPDHAKSYRSLVTLWLLDSDYDDDVAKAIAISQSSNVLVGFSQAPYYNEVQHYARWQRQLKRKLAQLLQIPILMHNPIYDSELPTWRYVVLLGASMGGPNAVKAFLDNLSPALPICILLAHHFNKSMLESLPRVLNRHNKWQCQVINMTQRLRAGYCLIAPIEQQIVCDSEGRVIVMDKQWEGDYKPSIGQLLKNTSDVYGSELISIIFSGMGDDGSQYLDEIQANNSQLWAQDPKLSACPSQPQAIVDSGYCQFIGSPEALAQRLTDYISNTTAAPFLL